MSIGPRHAYRAPGLALGLDEDVGFAAAHRGDLRLAGPDFLPDGLVVEWLVDPLLLLGRSLRGLLGVDGG